MLIGDADYTVQRDGTTTIVTVKTSFADKIADIIVKSKTPESRGIVRMIQAAKRNVRYVQHCTKYNEDTTLHLYFSKDELCAFVEASAFL